MDHHTYAKSGSKKWSAEEKHQLVEQRIAADELFSKYSPKHAEPWKKFKDMAKIGEFSEIALRKQWFSMVQRYRVHKANTEPGSLTKEKIEEINKEWEFFGLIHAYMNQKTADLHSYALKEPNVETPTNNLAISNVYSCKELMLGVLNDHNFCERSPPNEGGDTTDDADDPPSTYENNNNNDELNKLLAEATTQHEVDRGSEDISNAYHGADEMECGLVMIGGEVSLSNNHYNDFYESLESPQLSSPSPSLSSSKQMEQKPMRKIVKKPKRKLSAKDKYYKHRLGYDQRMEKRLMGLCTVVGRLLQQFAPNVDVQPLLDMGDDRGLKSQSSASMESKSYDEEDEEGQNDDDEEDDENEENGGNGNGIDADEEDDADDI
ncbi:hypothetical protein KR200_005371 [Drosophila serrata]|nr:hypothetical protein KR200_005371 [Drosophila serrata]